MSSSQKKNMDVKLENRPVTDEAILKFDKEVVVKFIEVGRLTPANFDETFRAIHKTICEAFRS